jgi:hypothetical protein
LHQVHSLRDSEGLAAVPGGGEGLAQVGASRREELFTADLDVLAHLDAQQPVLGIGGAEEPCCRLEVAARGQPPRQSLDGAGSTSRVRKL